MSRRTLRLLTRFQRDQRGTSGIEYSLLAVMVAIFIMSTVNFFSTQIDNLNKQVASALQEK